MELDALNGTVMRMAREPTVSTPFNFAVYAALQPYAYISFASRTDAFPTVMGRTGIWFTAKTHRMLGS